MVNNEYSTNIYKSLNISIGTMMKNPEMLKFVPDYFKTKKMCKRVLKNYLIYYYMPLIDIRLNKCMIKLS